LIPHLQSLVVLVVKTVLSHVTSLITTTSSMNGMQAGFVFQDGQNGVNGVNGDNGNGLHDVSEISFEDMDMLRTEEITAKAGSGLLLLLMKWLKVSRKLTIPRIDGLLRSCRCLEV
jgi:hypothetical protein